jgi:proline racemase
VLKLYKLQICLFTPPLGDFQVGVELDELDGALLLLPKGLVVVKPTERENKGEALEQLLPSLLVVVVSRHGLRVGIDCGGGGEYHGGIRMGGSTWALITAAVGSAGVEPRQNRALVLWTPTVDT